jgi:radical SAM superfamily enzyme YgiQ (UPF0313 family)
LIAMSVLLLRPYPKNSICSAVPPLGLGYLATALLHGGIEASILDLGNLRYRPADLDRALGESPPGLVGVQVYTREIPATRAMIQGVRERLGPRVPIVVGGPHPSTMPEAVFDHLPEIDFAVVGEGEIALPLLARHVAGDAAVTRESIPGLAWREGGRVRVNPSVFADDVDAFGVPAWDRMRLDGYRTEILGGGFTRRAPAMTMLTSRGCPFRCAFCCARALCGRKLRLRDPGAVVDEMAVLRERHGFQEIKILDDNFNAVRAHVLGIAEAFRRRPVDVSVSVACGLHLHTLDEEVVDALAAIGAYELMIAIESGSQRVLDRMKKTLDLREVPEKVAMIRRKGFKVIAYFLLGFPGETKQETERTVRLALDLPLDRAHFNCFSPMPGSEVHDDLVTQGRLAAFDLRHAHFETINYSFVDGLTAPQLNRLRQRALLRFYLRPRVFFGLWRSFASWSSVKFLARKAAEYFGLVR